MLLCELLSLKEFFDPTAGISGMLADYFISLKASEIEEISTDAAVKEIQKRYGVETTMEDLTTMFSNGELPMVRDLNKEKIYLDIKDSEIKNKDLPDSEETVQDMARAATEI